MNLNNFKTALVALLIIPAFQKCTRPEDNALNNNQEITVTDTSSFHPTGPQTRRVEISQMKFNPENVIVHIGDTIVWQNRDITNHCITEESGKKWTSSALPKDSSWAMVVRESANYYCAIHQVMKGKITVE